MIFFTQKVLIEIFIALIFFSIRRPPHRVVLSFFLNHMFCRRNFISITSGFSSLNSYPIAILFGLFERAYACALNFLVDFNYYLLTYHLIKT